MSQHFIINLMYMYDIHAACIYIDSKCVENCAYHHTFLLASLILEKSLSLGYSFLISASGLYDLLYRVLSCGLFEVENYHKVCPGN